LTFFKGEGSCLDFEAAFLFNSSVRLVTGIRNLYIHLKLTHMYSKLILALSVAVCLSCNSTKTETKAEGTEEKPKAEEKPEVVKKEFSMKYWNAPDAPPVVVTADIPASWGIEISKVDGGASFTIPEAEYVMPAIVAMEVNEPTEAARFAKIVKFQFGDDEAAASKTGYDDGRVLVVFSNETNVHARMFVPAPKGYIMASIMMTKKRGAAVFDKIQEMFETIQVKK
jgi:hypothetical protein